MQLTGANDQLAEVLVHRDHQSLFGCCQRQNSNVGQARIQITDSDHIQVLTGKPALYSLADADIYHDFHAAASR
jgi:hypothetical protein